MIAQAIRLDGVLEVFYPVLGLAAVHVPVVDNQWILTAGGDDKARIGSFAEGFGFVDDAAWMGPCPRLIGRLTGQADLTSTLGLADGQRLGEQRGSNDRQATIRNEADGVSNVVGRAPGVQPWNGKAAVGAEFDGDLRPGRAQPLDQPAEDQHDETGFVAPSRAEDSSYDLVGLAVENQQRVVHV